MIKLFEQFNQEKDFNSIITELLPFVIGKYNELGKWVESKSSSKPEKLKKIIFEYLDKPQYWEVVLIVSGWRSNIANRMIEISLSSEVIKKAKNLGVDLHFLTHAALHVPMNTHYIIYDVEKSKIEKI
jgi:hypothetical protein